jgi:glycogen debranching enzyme
VLNHTATNSEWLFKNPDSGYNLQNSPHLCVAYELDKVLFDYSKRYSEKRVSCKASPFIYNDNDLNELICELSGIVNKQNFEEYFMISLDHYVPIFENHYNEYKKELGDCLQKRKFLLNKLKENKKDQCNENDVFQLISDACVNYGQRRFGVELDNIEFVGLLLLKDEYIHKSCLSEYIADLKKILNRINNTWVGKAKEMVAKAIENTKAYVKYEFITLGRHKVTSSKKLTENYFAIFEENNPQGVFACNGWLFGVNDPTINFALYPSWNYFTRSIIIWGDCAKLHYGKCPEDSPYLWKHMTKYVQDMAMVFDGFRLDNAHSTPIHVAEYLMAQARQVNPDLIIMAELFAGTKERELLFINRIGINLMIREAIYCSNPSELDEKLYRYGSGGKDAVLGALNTAVKKYVRKGTDIEAIGYNILSPIYPKSIIFDITHDNPTLHERFNNLGLNLTFLATISMTMSSIGSTRGFDQLFPYQPSVIRENRVYKYKSHEIESDVVTVDFTYKRPGATNIKLAISSNNWKPDIVLSKVSSDSWHTKLTLKRDIYYYKFVVNDSQWVHDTTKETITDSSGNVNNVLKLLKTSDLGTVRRIFGTIREECVNKRCQFYLHRDRDLIAMFKLFEDNHMSEHSGYAMICRTGYDSNGKPEKYKVELPGEIQEVIAHVKISVKNFDINLIRSDSKLVGVESILEFSSGTSINGATVTKLNGNDIIEGDFLPNTVILLKLKNVRQKEIQLLRDNINFLAERGGSLISEFNLCDLNGILYKCEKEELDNSNGKRGNYEIPQYGKLVYAGITHIYALIQKLKKSQDLGNSLFKNIRDGDWLLEYTINRLSDFKTSGNLYIFLVKDILNPYKAIGGSIKPKLFCMIIETLYTTVVKKVLSQSGHLIDFNEFGQNLLLANLQFTGFVESSRFKNTYLSISAGLPHFSTEYMRCWGRDTFISFKGLLLIPGYFKEAKEIIINFSRTMRHGLIPNLLDGGNNPRYNARDAVWFYLNAIRDYIQITDDPDILNTDVDLLFLDDDMTKHFEKLRLGQKKIIKLYDVIQMILQSHVSGIQFREWRAGKQIDEHMKDEGFNQKIFYEKTTGFIYGGNKFNCGTWMDKMGSSEKAKNKGIPATPRDGADVEIIGLLYSFIKFLADEMNPNHYPYDHVKEDGGVNNLTYKSWYLKIQDNFEKYFFIQHKRDDSMVNKENIYKDHISIPSVYTNYQLRPNFLIAMAIAPELFTQENALKALEQVETYLLVKNGLGIRTLDPEDLNYNGNYINSNDSNTYGIAHGFNYHNVKNY